MRERERELCVVCVNGFFFPFPRDVVVVLLNVVDDLTLV
jgi:hypothetical protein